MADYSLARLRRVFGLGSAELSLMVGLAGPALYVLGYLILFNTGVDGSTTDAAWMPVWEIVAGVWMFGLPLLGIPGVLLGIRGFKAENRGAAVLGVLCNVLWLSVWAFFALLVVSGVSV